MWVSDLAQLVMFSTELNWKAEITDTDTYCLEQYIETCREQVLNLFLVQKLSLSCMLSSHVMGHGSTSQTLCFVGECVGED